MNRVFHCNLCGSKDNKVVLIENRVDIVKCKNCGFVYTQNLPEKIFERPEKAEDLFRQTENKGGYITKY